MRHTDTPVGPGELRLLLKSWAVSVPHVLLKERWSYDLRMLASSPGAPLTGCCSRVYLEGGAVWSRVCMM